MTAYQRILSPRGLTRSLAMLLLLGGSVVASCGGEQVQETDAAEAVAAPEAAMPEQPPAQGGTAGYNRESFVLCPVIEEHKNELASIVGFTADSDRSVETFRFECNIHGESGSLVKVQLAPAFTSSIAMHASGYEDPSSAAPELGNDALYVDAPMQPHVIFHMGDLIIDVGAEALDAPNRATMIELAERVRDLLTEANS